MSKTQSSSCSRERHRGCLYPAWYPILHLEHAHFEHAHTTGLTPHRVCSIKPSMTSTCTRIAHSESTLPWHPNSLLSCMLLSTLISKLIERSTRLNLIKSITQTYSLHMEYTTMVLCLHCNPIKQTKHCSSNCWMDPTPHSGQAHTASLMPHKTRSHTPYGDQHMHTSLPVA